MAGKGIELGTEFSNASSMGAEAFYRGAFMSMEVDRKSTRLNSSH